MEGKPKCKICASNKKCRHHKKVAEKWKQDDDEVILVDCDESEQAPANKRPKEKEIDGVLERNLKFLLTFDPPPCSPEFRGDLCFVGSDSVPVYAHRFVMAGKSPIIKKMFTVDMVEKETGTVRVDEVTAPVLRALVKFCYTAEITFESDSMSEEVLKLAHKYQIPELIASCDEYLSTTIAAKDVCTKIRLGYTYGLEKLLLKTQEYVRNNFDSIYDPVMKELLLEASTDKAAAKSAAHDGESLAEDNKRNLKRGVKRRTCPEDTPWLDS